MKKILLFALTLSINNAIAMENPLKNKLPEGVRDLLATFLPSRTCEDDGEFQRNAANFSQGILNKNDIIVKQFPPNKDILFRLGVSKMSGLKSFMLGFVSVGISADNRPRASIRRIKNRFSETIWEKTLEDSNSTIDLFSFSRDHSKIIHSLNSNGQLLDKFIIYDRKQQKEIAQLNYGCDGDSVVSLAVTSDGKYAAFLKKSSHDYYLDSDDKDSRFLKYHLRLVDTENNEWTDAQCLKELPYLFPAPNPVITFNKQGTKLIVYLQPLSKQIFICPKEIEPDLQEKEFIGLYSIGSEKEHEQKTKKTWKDFCREKTLYNAEKKDSKN